MWFGRSSPLYSTPPDRRRRATSPDVAHDGAAHQSVRPYRSADALIVALSSPRPAYPWCVSSSLGKRQVPSYIRYAMVCKFVYEFQRIAQVCVHAVLTLK
jgi:hypothetical protein